MDDPVLRGLTLEQAHNERRDRAITDLYKQMERVINLLEDPTRQGQLASCLDDQH